MQHLRERDMANAEPVPRREEPAEQDAQVGGRGAPEQGGVRALISEVKNLDTAYLVPKGSGSHRSIPSLDLQSVKPYAEGEAEEKEKERKGKKQYKRMIKKIISTEGALPAKLFDSLFEYEMALIIATIYYHKERRQRFVKQLLIVVIQKLFQAIVNKYAPNEQIIAFIKNYLQQLNEILGTTRFMTNLSKIRLKESLVNYVSVSSTEKHDMKLKIMKEADIFEMFYALSTCQEINAEISSYLFFNFESMIRQQDEAYQKEQLSLHLRHQPLQKELIYQFPKLQLSENEEIFDRLEEFIARLTDHLEMNLQTIKLQVAEKSSALRLKDLSLSSSSQVAAMNNSKKLDLSQNQSQYLQRKSFQSPDSRANQKAGSLSDLLPDKDKVSLPHSQQQSTSYPGNDELPAQIQQTNSDQNPQQQTTGLPQIQPGTHLQR